MRMRQLRLTTLLALLLLIPFAAACDGPSSGPSDVMADVTGDVTADAETDIPSDTTAELDSDPTKYPCGHRGVECSADQACSSTGQGACMGPPPGPEGCGPDCTATRCGAGDEVCLCAWFECVDVGACTTCECIVALPGRGSCLCSDAGDHFTLSCPGA